MKVYVSSEIIDLPYKIRGKVRVFKGSLLRLAPRTASEVLVKWGVLGWRPSVPAWKNKRLLVLFLPCSIYSVVRIENSTVTHCFMDVRSQDTFYKGIL